ncbi:hypothetical protein LEP1GSC036_2103 [Leptospira weilii str. 2006001853]|uniref:Uncharacterized protein n=1 Tax=Leptospira weilii str. 2006001853 TaxID=1001589 RepID=A0A828Z136_9LEPT|nr:hypothetical protein LEP1GSC036_2103 [Leptospira weilii str. 2006001853]
MKVWANKELKCCSLTEPTHQILGSKDKSVGIPTKSPVKLSSHNAILRERCAEFPLFLGGGE